jgi:predicted RNA-binding Zn-ribbon protein involved in translation (DUF1610 family)
VTDQINLGKHMQHKKIKGQVEWVCKNCNSVHIQRICSSDDIINITCSDCGYMRRIHLINKPENEIVSDWLSEKCPHCTVLKDCFSSTNKKLLEKRMTLIGKLSFCEEYVVDFSKLPSNPRQVCQEEKTFHEIYNKGEI